MTRREAFRKTWRLLAGDILIGAMLEMLILGALFVVLVLGGSVGKVSPGGMLLMLLLPVPILFLEMVLYHWRYLLDLLFISIPRFSGRVTRVNRMQKRRCDDYTFALCVEGPDGLSRTFFLFGDLMKEHYGELMQACSSKSFLPGPVSFRYLRRSKYMIELLEWPWQKEPPLKRKR